jgi:Fe-S-cluster containining protein
LIEIQEDVGKEHPWFEDSKVVADMLVPLGNQLGKDGVLRPYYTCRHVQVNGDCGIYEHRPRLCRDYPSYAGGRTPWRGEPCEHKNCTRKALKMWALWEKVRRWWRMRKARKLEVIVLSGE